MTPGADTGAGPALPPPPGEPYRGAVPFFRALNRWFMVPLTRRGLGAWVSTPFGGAILLLRVRGRKSGLVRETPLNYVIHDGAAWVLAGLGPRTQWFQNLVEEPAVEVLLPGREPFRATAREMREPSVREMVLPRILRSTIGPAAGSGLNPFGSAESTLETMSWVPLVRLDPVDGRLEPGPDDPGGHGWIWRQAVLTLALLLALRALRRAMGWLRR